MAEAIASLRPDTTFLYAGTRGGPERALVRAAGLPYAAVAAGRLRRYLTWRNVVDPALVMLGVAQAWRLARSFRPDVAFGAGGFATVPPLLASMLTGARIAIHQQDVTPSLANRLLAPFASAVTTAFPGRIGGARRPAHVVGNPVRKAVMDGDPAFARRAFGLSLDKPVVLATGGGTGALVLNRIVAAAAQDLRGTCEIIHLTGVGKSVGGPHDESYRQIEFLTTEMPHALAVADVIVTRAGMSALAEVAALGKTAIVVPMPNSHQEANADVLLRHRAAVVYREGDLSPETLTEEIRRLLSDAAEREALGTRVRQLLPPGAAAAIAEEVIQLAASPRK